MFHWMQTQIVFILFKLESHNCFNENSANFQYHMKMEMRPNRLFVRCKLIRNKFDDSSFSQNRWHPMCSSDTQQIAYADAMATWMLRHAVEKRITQSTGTIIYTHTHTFSSIVENRLDIVVAGCRWRTNITRCSANSTDCAMHFGLCTHSLRLLSTLRRFFFYSADDAFVYSRSTCFQAHGNQLCLSPYDSATVGNEWGEVCWYFLTLESQADHAQWQHLHFQEKSSQIDVSRQHSTMMISTADVSLEFNDSVGENSAWNVIYWPTKRKITLIMTCINFCFIYCYKLWPSNFL